jgi:hypothetical protein
MKSPLVLTLSAISLLTACSGGGSGFNDDGNGNNGGNVPGPGAGVTLDITSANALLVTNVSYQAALSSGALAGFSSGTGLLASEPGGISKIDRSLAISDTGGNATANLVIPEIIEACLGPLGGMITFSGEIADPVDPLAPLTLTPGDSFNIFYQACDDGFAVIDGNLFYEVDAFNGELESGLYSLTMTATFTDFQVTTLEDEIVSNGDVTVRLDTRQFPYLEAEVSGTSLTVDGNTSAVIMTNFASLHAQDTGLAPFPYTQTSSGTVDSTMLSGIVSYATPIDFQGSGADYPSVGEFLVTGNNSSARLTAIDSVNVRIEIDTDGDGTVNDTINITWAELEGS